MSLSKVYRMQAKRQKQEDPFNLRSLPMVEPPGDDGWPAVQQALLAQGRQRRIWKTAGGALAAAATVVLAFSLWLSPEVAPDRQIPGLAVTDTEPAPTVLESRAETLQSLMSLSQRLENRLRAYRDELGDLPAGSVIYQVELQDLVAQVDDQISARPDSLELWSQRVNLLLDISRLYENSLRREYQQLASL
jgi:hypothetical protein